MIDARISIGLPTHPKMKKLIRRIGTDGAWRLVCLFLWAAQNRPDGDLSGMSAEDIELSVDWSGEPDVMVKAMVDVGFLEGDDGGYRIHDWEEHNPWASGAEERSWRAKWKALVRHHGKQRASELMPEYVKRYPSVMQEAQQNDAHSKKQHAGSKEVANEVQCGQHDSAMQNDAERNAPSPNPNPNPNPNPKKHSEAIASGGKPPTMTADEIIFGYGVPMLTGAGIAEKQARSFLGGLRKEHGDGLVIDKLRDCMRAKPLQPLEWLAAALPPGGGRRAGKQAQVVSRNAAVVADWRPPEIREAA